MSDSAFSSQQCVMFSSGEEKWGTPRWLFNELNLEFRFTLDVCATKESAKCDRFFSPEQNGLDQQWEGMCWMNPPYGKGIAKWMRKAWEESQNGATIICLVPARTDTAWFHDWVLGKAEIRFLRGRLEFAGFGGTGASRGAAPFASMLAIFRPTATIQPA